MIYQLLALKPNKNQFKIKAGLITALPALIQPIT